MESHSILFTYHVALWFLCYSHVTSETKLSNFGDQGWRCKLSPISLKAYLCQRLRGSQNSFLSDFREVYRTTWPEQATKDNYHMGIIVLRLI